MSAISPPASPAGTGVRASVARSGGDGSGPATLGAGSDTWRTSITGSEGAAAVSSSEPGRVTTGISPRDGGRGTAGISPCDAGRGTEGIPGCDPGRTAAKAGRDVVSRASRGTGGGRGTVIAATSEGRIDPGSMEIRSLGSSKLAGLGVAATTGSGSPACATVSPAAAAEAGPEPDA
ncbi:MAG: hypothetical protein IT379_38260, partial [Deltaproteobacteria bacterium]|nr:hypothetical protein [Deltaproteobacteria bacterium]